MASHYLEDYILHWDVGTGLSNGSRKRSTAFLLELGDLAIAAGLVWFMYKSATPSVQMHTAIGAFVGLLPDFMEAPRNFLHWNPWFLKPFNKFQHSLHHSTPNMVKALIPHIVLLVALFSFR